MTRDEAIERVTVGITAAKLRGDTEAPLTYEEYCLITGRRDAHPAGTRGSYGVYSLESWLNDCIQGVNRFDTD